MEYLGAVHLGTVSPTGCLWPERQAGTVVLQVRMGWLGTMLGFEPGRSNIAYPSDLLCTALQILWNCTLQPNCKLDCDFFWTVLQPLLSPQLASLLVMSPSPGYSAPIDHSGATQAEAPPRSFSIRPESWRPNKSTPELVLRFGPQGR